ncbi:C-type mannose receptor 2-like isoform X1 [Gadus morhua]|uniref:C-type mannose receptor 2-like isoform X1 n=1 Tax=Gadus morhua TaxID=8049 RepID=UPI0011B65C66|nr:C-type mannose receptor 2-like isoform X1 [Gadus morhua]
MTTADWNLGFLPLKPSMDTRVLICLLFSGVCFTSAGLNKYVLVEEDKTWYEAQEYCRSRIGDLATVTNMEDLNLLSNMTAGAESWIGLNDFNRKTMDLYPNSWRWSNQTRSRSGYMNFVSDQPDYWLGKEECVTTGTNGTWNDDRCSTLYPFVCFSGSSNNKAYHLIEQTLSWESAKSYCRTNYIDLAMIENEEENQKVLSIITTYVWIGLYRVPWTFSDGTNSSFRHWWSYEPNNVNNNQLCVGLYDGGFSDMECTTTFPFICSVGQKYSRIKIMIESNLDLTNQNTKDNILLQLSASLTRAGRTDFNLSWSAPPEKLDPAGLNDDNQ